MKKTLPFQHDDSCPLKLKNSPSATKRSGIDIK